MKLVFLIGDAAAQKTSLRVRNTPRIFKEDEMLQAYAAAIGPAVQQYAVVFEREVEGVYANEKRIQ